MDAATTLCALYRRNLADLLKARGQSTTMHYLRSHYAFETLAAAGTALFMAVLERVSRPSGPADPFLTVSELRHAASQIEIPPDGRQVAISDPMYQTLITQPPLVQGEDGSWMLGPLLAAAVRTVAEGVRRGWLVMPDAVMPILRTIDLHYMRDDQALLGAAATSHQNGGAGLLLASREMIAADGGLDSVAVRGALLGAVWRELSAAGGGRKPIVWRGERRYKKQAGEGCATHEGPWYVHSQPGWEEALEETMPPGAIVIVEFARDGLHDWVYRHRGRAIRLDRTERLLIEAELYPMWHDVEYLMIRDPEREAALGADRMLRLGGTVESATGRRYSVLFARTRTFWAPFAIRRELAARLSADDWEDVRAAIAPLHGRTSGAVSDDQGLAHRLPYEEGLKLAARDPVRAANLDSIRELTHALGRGNHWLAGPGSPGDAGLRRTG